jgi:hypothetical protein
LLEHILQYLLQSIRVRLECGEHILNGALNQDTVHHAETFAVLRKRVKGFDNKPEETRMSAPCNFIEEFQLSWCSS